MGAYIARRLVWAVIVMLAVATMAFLLTFLAPTDPAKSLAGTNASPAAVERIRVALGLDRPILEQLAGYLGRLATGDLGTSYEMGGVRVLDLLLARFVPTFVLAVSGVLLAVAVGVPLGVRAAQHPGGRLDRLCVLLSSLLVSVPSFLFGVLVIYYVAYQWRLVPIPGTRQGMSDPRMLVLPAITLAITAIPFYLRVSRTATLEALREDYVRTARAKGLGERAVVWRHAFRNAMTPLVTLVGMDLGFLLGGVVVIEAVFGWPGLGLLAVDAITSEDIPVLMGSLLLATFCIVLLNLIVDVVRATLDPRIRIEDVTG
jgi:peptide/nickel transport system permease protein